MRHVSQILELALKTLFTNTDEHMPYMCCHLDRMAIAQVITADECDTAVLAINKAINRSVTVAQYLRSTGGMPRHIYVADLAYVPYGQEFYRKLIAQLRADDPMFLIIESAYHCGCSHEHIHQMVEEAGLPETSDETISNLLGKYAEGIVE